MNELDEVIDWLKGGELCCNTPHYLGTGAGSAGELEAMAIARLERVKARITELEEALVLLGGKNGEA